MLIDIIYRWLSARGMRGPGLTLLADVLGVQERRSAGLDTNAPFDGRRLSNIGCFRVYVTAYLRAHPQLRHDMDFLVRQRQPSDKGLPLELYVFSSDTRLAAYESIQSDIFDHLLTVVPEFELRVFQSPTGHDFRLLSPPARDCEASRN